MDQLTNTINAADAANPLSLLALAILLLVLLFGVGIWKLTPILQGLAEKIPQRLDESNKAIFATRQTVAQSNEYNAANARAIGSVAETLSLVTNTMTEGQTKLAESQQKLTASQEALAGHFDRMVDVMSNVYSSIDQQTLQMNKIIAGTNATQKAAESTHAEVVEMQSTIAKGMGELSKISALLREIREQNDSQQQIKPADLEKLSGKFDSVKDEIIAAIRTMTGEPTLIKVPAGTVGFEVEMTKEGV